jgi:hypothetical protein
METIELALILFVAVAAFGAMAKWIALPLPIILTAGGALLSDASGLVAFKFAVAAVATATEKRLKLTALEAERVELLALRDSEVINEQTLRAIEAEIDHAEMLIVGVPRVGHG